MPADCADTAETHGFKAFTGFGQGKPLIQTDAVSESRLFPENRVDFRLNTDTLSLPAILLPL